MVVALHKIYALKYWMLHVGISGMPTIYLKYFCYGDDAQKPW